MKRKPRKAICKTSRHEFAPPAGQPPPAPATALEMLARVIDVLAGREATPMNLATFKATLSSECLEQTFGISVPPELFGISDLLWADNVVRQLEGTDVLCEGAREKMQQWYREHAMPYYFEKLQPPRTQPRQESENAECGDVVAQVDEKRLH